MNSSVSASLEDLLSLDTMPKAEFEAKLKEGIDNAKHMDDCKHRDTCLRCIQYKKEGYQRDWRTGVHYSPFERRAPGARSLRLIA